MVAFPDVAPGRDLTVSATTFIAWLRCPEQVRTRLDETLPGTVRFPAETREGFRGSLAHRILARHLTLGEIEPAQFEQACREESGHTSLQSKMGDLRLKPSEFRVICRQVADDYERFRQLRFDGFNRAEVAVAHQPASGVVLKGTVDAVFELPGGGIALVDWKTGDLGDAQPQLAFYAALWALAYGEPPTLVEAASLRTGERHEHRPTGHDLAATLRTVADLVTAVRTAYDTGDELPRHGSPECRWCPILQGCPEGESALTLIGRPVA